MRFRETKHSEVVFADEDFEYGIEHQIHMLEVVSKDPQEMSAVTSNFYFQPEDFFSKENLEFESQYLPGQRLAHIGQVVKNLKCKPSVVRKYFTDPANAKDLFLLQQVIREKVGGHKELQDVVFGVSKEEKNCFREFYVERRELVPERYLNDDFLGADIDRSIYFERGGIKKVMNAALSGNPFQGNVSNRDLVKMFSDKAFSEYDDEKKTKILNALVHELHLRMLFSETHNTIFGPDNSRTTKNSFFDIAHSIIFRTEQPLSSYFLDQSVYARFLSDPQENYDLQKIMLATLNEIYKVESLHLGVFDLVVDFWDKNRNPIFANAVLSVLSRNPNYSAKLLIEKLKLCKTPADRTAINAMLFWLELGDMEISEKGVKMFEEWFDLGEYNTADFIARRTTGDGQVAIFDKETRSLQGFVSPDFSLAKSPKKLSVLFLKGMLFDKLKSEKLNDAEKAEIIKIFQSEYAKIFLDYFNDYLGVDISRFTAQEQMNVFVCLMNMSESEEVELSDFIRKNKESGFAALGEIPSLSYLKYFANFETEDVLVFNKIKQTIGQVRTVNPIYADILVRKLEEILASKKTLEEVRGSFQNFDAEILVSVALAREKDFQNFEIEVQSNEQVSDALKNFMRRGYLENYSEGTERDSLLKDLEDNFKNPNVKFFIVYEKENRKKPVGYMVIQDTQTKDIDNWPIYYASAFNMLNTTQRQGLGEKFMETVIKHFGQRGIVHADCDAQKMGPTYLKFGFVGINIYKETDSGKIIMDIADSLKYRSGDFSLSRESVESGDENSSIPVFISKDDENFATKILNEFEKHPGKIIRKMGPENSVILEDRRISFERN